MGKGRGGTSLVANMLVELGVDMGKNLKGPIDINPNGCFENLEILTLTQKILRDAKCGGTLDNINTKESEERILHLKSKYDTEIRKVVENNRNALWGWKDERNCFAIRLFLPYLENPHFVIVHRNMYSVAESLRRCDGTKIEHGLLSAMSFYKKIFEFIDETDYPNYHIKFEDLFDPIKYNQIAKELANFIGSNLEIKNLTEKELKHF